MRTSTEALEIHKFLCSNILKIKWFRFFFGISMDFLQISAFVEAIETPAPEGSAAGTRLSETTATAATAATASAGTATTGAVPATSNGASATTTTTSSTSGAASADRGGEWLSLGIRYNTNYHYHQHSNNDKNSNDDSYNSNSCRMGHDGVMVWTDMLFADLKSLVFHHIFVWGSCFWLCTSARRLVLILLLPLPAPATHNLLTHRLLGDIDLHFAWQAWHLATSIVILRGRRGMAWLH